MYVCINCLNIFSMDSRGVGAKTGPRVGSGPNSRLGKYKVAELGLFGALLPYAVAIMRGKGLFGLLGTTESHKRLL